MGRRPKLSRRCIVSQRPDPSRELTLGTLPPMIAAREKALLRAGQANAELSVVNLERDCALPAAERDWLQQALDKLGASARAYHRILRVARTIADLEGGAGCVEQQRL